MFEPGLQFNFIYFKFPIYLLRQIPSITVFLASPGVDTEDLLKSKLSVGLVGLLFGDSDLGDCDLSSGG